MCSRSSVRPRCLFRSFSSRWRKDGGKKLCWGKGHTQLVVVRKVGFVSCLESKCELQQCCEWKHSSETRWVCVCVRIDAGGELCMRLGWGQRLYLPLKHLAQGSHLPFSLSRFANLIGAVCAQCRGKAGSCPSSLERNDWGWNCERFRRVCEW